MSKNPHRPPQLPLLQQMHDATEQTPPLKDTLQLSLKDLGQHRNTIKDAMQLSPLKGLQVPTSVAIDATNRLANADYAAKITSMKDLGVLIRTARLARKLSQQAFADQAGVGRRFVSELENGKATLQFDKVIEVAATVGIELFARER